MMRAILFLSLIAIAFSQQLTASARPQILPQNATIEREDLHALCSERQELVDEIESVCVNDQVSSSTWSFIYLKPLNSCLLTWCQRFFGPQPPPAPCVRTISDEYLVNVREPVSGNGPVVLPMHNRDTFDLDDLTLPTACSGQEKVAFFSLSGFTTFTLLTQQVEFSQILIFEADQTRFGCLVATPTNDQTFTYSDTDSDSDHDVEKLAITLPDATKVYTMMVIAPCPNPQPSIGLFDLSDPNPGSQTRNMIAFFGAPVPDLCIRNIEEQYFVNVRRPVSGNGPVVLPMHNRDTFNVDDLTLPTACSGPEKVAFFSLTGFTTFTLLAQQVEFSQILIFEAETNRFGCLVATPTNDQTFTYSDSDSDSDHDVEKLVITLPDAAKVYTMMVIAPCGTPGTFDVSGLPGSQTRNMIAFFGGPVPDLCIRDIASQYAVNFRQSSPSAASSAVSLPTSNADTFNVEDFKIGATCPGEQTVVFYSFTGVNGFTLRTQQVKFSEIFVFEAETDRFGCLVANPALATAPIIYSDTDSDSDHDTDEGVTSLAPGTLYTMMVIAPCGTPGTFDQAGDFASETRNMIAYFSAAPQPLSPCVYDIDSLYEVNLRPLGSGGQLLLPMHNFDLVDLAKLNLPTVCGNTVENVVFASFSEVSQFDIQTRSLEFSQILIFEAEPNRFGCLVENPPLYPGGGVGPNDFFHNIPFQDMDTETDTQHDTERIQNLGLDRARVYTMMVIAPCGSLFDLTRNPSITHVTRSLGVRDFQA